MSDNVAELAELYFEALELQGRVRKLHEKKKQQTISDIEMELLKELETKLRGVIARGKLLSS